jgi:hypothetical protein
MNKHENETCLCSPFSEKSFRIENHEFFLIREIIYYWINKGKLTYSSMPKKRTNFGVCLKENEVNIQGSKFYLFSSNTNKED